MLRKQEPERNQLLQQLNQTDTVVQDDNFILEKNTLNIKKVPSEQNVKFELLIPAPFVFRIRTERQKGAFIMDAKFHEVIAF